MATISTDDLLKQYEAEFRFADRDYYDRHLVFDHVVTMEQADQRQRFEAWPARCATCSPSAGC